MKKCDKCNRPATVHIIEIVNGAAVEKHLCDIHAAEDGALENGPKPLEALVQKFVTQAGTGTGAENNPASRSMTHDPRCPGCGLLFSEFRQRGVLGCPGCYDAFNLELVPLLSRAHEGAEQHVGKSPRGHDQTEEGRFQRLIALRKKLEQAVLAEEYENAADLRNEIEKLQAQSESEN